MAEETIITWNFPNWFTVFGMVAIGAVILAVGVQVFHNWRLNRQKNG